MKPFMLAIIQSPLTYLLTNFTYFALIAALIVSGLGVPIPEDIPLVFSGYLCHHMHSPIVQLQKAIDEEPDFIDKDGDGIPETPNPHKRHRHHVPDIYLMMLSGMFGVLIGDSIVFSIGRRGIDADNFVAHHLRKVLHSKRRERVERHFVRHGNLTVFVGRFAPGFRSIVFAFAGMSKMSYGRFLLIDGLAAAISVPTFILLGYHFAYNIDALINRIRHLEHIVIFPLIGLFVAIGVIIYFVRRRRKAAAPVLENV